MNKYIVKLKHLTFRRAVNKLKSLVKEMPVVILSKRVKKINAGFYERLGEYAERIAGSDGSSYYQKKDFRIGVITDEFMYNYYKDAVELIVVTPENYKELIDGGRLDCLMYISCWHGMAGDEWYGDVRHAAIPEVFRYADSKNIKTVFQSIEDPISYERFLPIAKQSRFIFTTCVEKLEDYKKDTGNSNVFLLEYGVNPLLHNPIGAVCKNKVESDVKTVFFAGSWMDIYKNRCKDMRLLFDGVIEAGERLIIADRNVAVKLPGYKYPRKYQGFLIPAIEHKALQKAHKLFDFNININTVQNSSTMCAMRAYELQALGCLMMSNYSLAISRNFPGIFMINNKEEAAYIAKNYESKELERIRADNLRNVMSCCTVYDRLNYIFSRCGIDVSFGRKTVGAVCGKITDKIKSEFDAQTYPEKKLVTEAELEPSEFDYLVYFSDDNSYSPNYIADLINGFKYTGRDYITKEQAGDAYSFFDGDADFSKSAIKSEKFVRESLDTGVISGKGFIIDGFEINETTRISAETKELAVIVPVYNNGRYLYDRCMRSLLRSSIFDKMRIYLIDDGSTDQETINIINIISKRYENVEAYFFEPGGSGSAARPRDKGVEISSEPYITYLDPDNEAVNDGYAKLLEKIKSEKCDMSFGSIYTRREDTLTRLGFLFKDELIKNPRERLIKENMRPQSVQACVVKRELIEDNGITNVEGAYGEDSLFFQELMIHAKSAYYINTPIHIYYAERAGSSVNCIDKSFFEKSLILEKEQVKRFKEYGVLGEYISRRLDYFMLNWYVEKLKRVDKEEKKACMEITDCIARLYGKKIQDYISDIEE